MDELTKLEKLFDNFRIAAQDGITVHGSLRTGYAVQTPAISGAGTSGFPGGIVPPPPPTNIGACCADDGSCTITTEADCTGTYQGDGTVCSPNPCCQPGTSGRLDICFEFPTNCCLISFNETVFFDAGCPCLIVGATNIPITGVTKTHITCEPYNTDHNCADNPNACDSVNPGPVTVDFNTSTLTVHNIPNFGDITHFGPPTSLDPLTFGFANCPWNCEDGSAFTAVITCT